MAYPPQGTNTLHILERVLLIGQKLARARRVHLKIKQSKGGKLSSAAVARAASERSYLQPGDDFSPDCLLASNETELELPFARAYRVVK
jgi:hypothetical protein